MNRNHLKLIAADATDKPHLYMDGSQGIKIFESSYIDIRNLEIEGPALNITGEEAS